IGMAQIGLRLGNERLHTVMTDFGFGRKTGVEIPGEAAGVLRPLSAWNDFSTGSIPMGQELAATPLQVIAAHAVLANGGRWITPHLVLRRAGNGPSSSVLSRTVLSRSTAAWMTSGPMVDVVRVGTARQSAVPGLSVFAKTGTAQKFDPATGAYSHDRHVCSCICGAPADQPRLLILVTVDEPKSDSERSGGTVAAAAAADILRQSLDLLPGDGPTSSSRDRWATDSSGSWQRIAEPLTR
ncbi:MAG: penicillin-binding protein 2, partial [Planctomycetaceae bacterium]|nr:penicillin-binding protein 2 [Planctomycetaceae bacterium]